MFYRIYIYLKDSAFSRYLHNFVHWYLNMFEIIEVIHLFSKTGTLHIYKPKHIISTCNACTKP